MYGSADLFSVTQKGVNISLATNLSVSAIRYSSVTYFHIRSHGRRNAITIEEENKYWGKTKTFFYRVTDITLDSKLHLIKAFGYFALVSKFMIRKDEIIIF